MTYVLEVRAAEGGDDAKSFAAELGRAYVRMFDRAGWKRGAPTESPGFFAVEVDADERLTQESGGHRVQRVPDNERSGRVHTSTVTVAVVELRAARSVFRESDVRVEYFSGTGAGGQHRNKKMCSVRATHAPTGKTAVAQSRSREANRRDALAELRRRVEGEDRAVAGEEVNAGRRAMVGTGMRGDKIRTYRFQDDAVVDHRTGRRARCSDVVNGRFDLLWE